MLLLKWIVSSLLFISCSLLANGGVYLDATRIIYHENDAARSIKVTNSSEELPYLIRSWISSHESDRIDKWVITPPVYRLNERNAIQLRITNLDKSMLPADRESLFFLNVLSIPGNEKGNDKDAASLSGAINIAINTRVKLFYRPQALKEIDSNGAHKKLIFKAEEGKLAMTNPTPFHLNFLSIQINGVAKKIERQMIPPFSTVKIDHETIPRVVSYRALNDFGGEISVTKKIL
ncbi:MAG TPA: molecular chaperone [Scandinavium sp.]|jgi:fimbrial chaperone protein